MKRVKGVLLVILVIAMSVPCFGNNVEIKRKKNKWLHETELTSIKKVNQENQSEADTFVY